MKKVLTGFLIVIAAIGGAAVFERVARQGSFGPAAMIALSMLGALFLAMLVTLLLHETRYRDDLSRSFGPFVSGKMAPSPARSQCARADSPMSRLWRFCGSPTARRPPRPPRSTKSATRPFTVWRKHFAGLAPVDVKRLKALELENAKLKRLLAERDLEVDQMREVNRK